MHMKKKKLKSHWYLFWRIKILPSKQPPFIQVVFLTSIRSDKMQVIRTLKRGGQNKEVIAALAKVMKKELKKYENTCSNVMLKWFFKRDIRLAIVETFHEWKCYPEDFIEELIHFLASTENSVYSDDTIQEKYVIFISFLFAHIWNKSFVWWNCFIFISTFQNKWKSFQTSLWNLEERGRLGLFFVKILHSATSL